MGLALRRAIQEGDGAPVPWGLTVVVWIVFLATSLLVLLPLLWLIETSLTNQVDWFRTPPALIPTRLTLQHYQTALRDPETLRFIGNTVVVSLVSALLSVFFGSGAAYVLARMKLPFKLNPVLLLVILLLRIYPPVTAVVPYYVIAQNLHLYDTVLILIIANVGFELPLTIWLMMGFFQEIPVEIERAAMVDRCTFWQRLLRIVLPLAVSGLVVSGIFAFLDVWNQFILPVALTSLRAKTLPVVIAGYVGDKGMQWGSMTAMGTIATVPLLIAFTFIQKQLVRGLTFGAVKG